MGDKMERGNALRSFFFISVSYYITRIGIATVIFSVLAGHYSIYIIG